MILEGVDRVRADGWGMYGDCLLGEFRHADSLDETAARLWPIKLPRDPFLGATAQGGVLVAIDTQDKVACAAPNTEHRDGQALIVIVVAEVHGGQPTALIVGAGDSRGVYRGISIWYYCCCAEGHRLAA